MIARRVDERAGVGGQLIDPRDRSRHQAGKIDAAIDCVDAETRRDRVVAVAGEEIVVDLAGLSEPIVARPGDDTRKDFEPQMDPPPRKARLLPRVSKAGVRLVSVMFSVAPTSEIASVSMPAPPLSLNASGAPRIVLSAIRLPAKFVP